MIQKNKRNYVFMLVLIIPAINAFANLTVNYFEAKSLNPGTLRAIYLFGIILICLPAVLKKHSINMHILGYLVYLFLLIIISSDFLFSVYNYIKVFVALTMFPIGYYYFKSYSRFILLNRILLIALSFFVINFIISNIFKLGTSDYLDETVYFGSGRVNIAKSVSIMTLIFPFYFIYAKPKNRLLVYVSVIILLISLLIVLLAVKRSALIVTLIGFVVYFLISPAKGRKIGYIFILGLFAISTSSLYLDVFLERFEAREDRFDIQNEELSKKEGRMIELRTVLKDYQHRNVFQIAFGREMFNDQSYYNSYRMLHSDYMILLHGAGVFGLLWLFYIYYLIVKKIFFYSKRLNIKWVHELKACLIALFAGIPILHIAGIVYNIDILSFLFLYSGASLGLLKSTRIGLLLKKQI